MLKKIAYGTLTLAMAGGMALGSAGAASAAHCVAPAGEESQPGFSYFGNDHVAEDSPHANEGRGQHAGTAGASNCRETTGSPSERAPGQN